MMTGWSLSQGKRLISEADFLKWNPLPKPVKFTEENISLPWVAVSKPEKLIFIQGRWCCGAAKANNFYWFLQPDWLGEEIFSKDNIYSY